MPRLGAIIDVLRVACTLHPVCHVKAPSRIDPEVLRAYLQNRGFVDVHIQHMTALGATEQAGLKDYGYGKPLHVAFTAAGEPHDIVVRTMSADPFGHDRRSDRARVLLEANDSFNTMPQHVRVLGCGAFDEHDGAMRAIPNGEIFLVTTYAEGELYANELRRVAALDAARPADILRAQTLARYLVDLHRSEADPSLYVGDLRVAIGSGEGIAGLCDSYPQSDPIATPRRLLAIEQRSITWRYRLRAYAHRARRTHGDFHPFNLLFRQGADFTALDCSRGGVGEPADDVTCLAINYLFFGLAEQGRFQGAMRQLWDVFWRTYLAHSGDLELLQCTGPYFAWRGLVVGSPVWYPHTPPAVREALFVFIERVLEAREFRPFHVQEWLP